MRRKGGLSALVIILAIIISAAALYLHYAGNQEVKRGKHSTKGTQADVLREKPSRNIQGKYAIDSTIPRETTSPARKRIAIVIDDIGYDLTPLYELLKIDASLTLAILPHYAHSVDAATIAHGAQREILLHLPMEPHTFPDENPGMGALFLSMSDRQIKDALDRDINAIPHLSGVNNHMGSKFMEDEQKLNIVFSELKKRNLFFVDSRTTSQSMGTKVARKLGLPFITRKVFIDNNNNDYTAIFRNLTTPSDEGFENESEAVVMIGHPHMKTIRALKEAIPVLKARGIDIVPVSKLVQ